MAGDATRQETDLGPGLAALLRRYHDAAAGALGSLPGGPRGFDVLSLSSEGACSNQATIAMRLGLDRTVMTYLVDDLEEAGLVERRPDPADRRARQVVLTQTGADVLADSTARVRAAEETVLSALSAEDAETFRSLLARAASGEVDRSTTCGEPCAAPD